MKVVKTTKVVLDTNVLVSGIFFWPGGPPHRVLEGWERGAFRLVVSPPVLNEYERVLAELAVRYPTVSYRRLGADRGPCRGCLDNSIRPPGLRRQRR